MDKYAIIGNPVKHSLSPKIHQLFGRQTEIDFEYIKIEAPLYGFADIVFKFRDDGGKGCNITIPFKSEAFALATQVGDNARLARAVNCFLFHEDNTIFGDNFDGIGLVEDLVNHHQYKISQKKILIIGAGGATQGIIAPLLEKAPSEIVVANRTAEKAYALAKQFAEKGPITGIDLTALPNTPFDLIIHATSLGHLNQLPHLPDGLISQNTFCYDLSYGLAAKPFLDWAQAQGAKEITDGIGMLVEQAAATFYLWHGIYPDTKPVLASLRVHP